MSNLLIIIDTGPNRVPDLVRSHWKSDDQDNNTVATTARRAHSCIGPPSIKYNRGRGVERPSNDSEIQRSGHDPDRYLGPLACRWPSIFTPRVAGQLYHCGTLPLRPANDGHQIMVGLRCFASEHTSRVNVFLGIDWQCLNKSSNYGYMGQCQDSND